jgi:glutathione S-transferase
MKLLFAPTSPFARKVRIAAGELGFADLITLEKVNPWTDVRLRALNPLGKVPTLELPDGSVLFESTVICDYLDGLGPRRLLVPDQDPERSQVLLVQGIADGAMTAVGRLFADEQRPTIERSELLMRRFTVTRDAALDWLERRCFRSTPQLGEIAVAAYLGYLDFRWPEGDWRSSRPRLAAWFDTFNERPSMRSTNYSTL